MLVPEWASTGPLISAEALAGILDGIGAENGELWVAVLLLTTGNKGWDTGTGGVDEGIPGGTTCAGWSAGDAVDARGGLTFCTGNKGCWAKPTWAGGGIEPAGCCGYQGCGRGATDQPAGGMGTAVL